MNAVELFSGIGGFRVASDLRFHRTLWANDICPKATEVYRDRFGGETFHEGDVQHFIDAIPSHELLTGGFPCQPFSSAGKKEGIRDSRGTLFQVIVDVLKTHQPKYFILENVKRLLTMEKGLHFATILSSLAELNYDIEWRLLNAMHFGLPQNRQRVFICGVLQDSRISRPTSIRLASFDDLTCLTNREHESLLDKNGWKRLEKHSVRFPTWGLVSRDRFFSAKLESFSERSELVPVRTILQDDVLDDFDFTETTLKWISHNTEVNRYVGGVEILSNQLGGARMGYTIFGINGVAPTLTSTTSRHYERYKIGNRYRRLTNIEYARIQGFPDNHCQAVSAYDQYALIGNAVPPAMAGWVMDRIVEVGRLAMDVPRQPTHRTLFDYAN